LRSLIAKLGLEFRAHFIERTNLSGFDLIEFENVIAELRLHWTADLARLHAEECLFEWTDEHAALRPAEITTLRCRARIFGVFFGQFREVRTSSCLLR
jgi:hypothetical protein